MRFFIACPANFATGGTELLHQLSWHLSNRGIENYMLYQNRNPVVSPTEDTFMKYQVRNVTSFVDDEQSILIVPETMIDMINICKKGVAIIWWLSVDNYITVYQPWLKQRNDLDLFALKGRENLIHFVQSKYAYEFVKQVLGIEAVSYLRDYINDDIIRIGTEYKNKAYKENICLFNPKKGAQNLEYIKKECRENIQWIPLQGLTPEQMAELMCRAKVYIDFGAHPGKDRIPREAAVCGCCIITNQKGSAAYEEDVGIPKKYKISDMQDYDHVLETIYDLIDNYDENVKLYASYVANILNEKKEFEEEISNMLRTIEKKCVTKYLTWKEKRYDSIFGNIQETVSKIHLLYKDSQKLYAGKELDKAVGELLKIDSALSVLRETNYMVIDDILATDI